MRGKRKGILLMAVGSVLVAAAFGLTGYNIWSERQAAESVSYALDQLQMPTLQERLSPEVSEAPATVLQPDESEVDHFHYY